MDIGKNTIIFPMGVGVMVSGAARDFENGVVGLVYRALPDDLVKKGELGEPLSEEDLARVEDMEDAPTVFLHFATPDALVILAQQADDLALEWAEHLELPLPVQHDKDTLLAAAEMVKTVHTWGLSPSQAEAVELFRKHTIKNLMFMAGVEVD